MANVKISELTALTPPDAADLVPVTDASASQTKRTTVGEIVGIINGDVDVADDGTATISELPVSKLQDGAARQLLQTDAAGTGVEWTSNVDVPGTLDVTSTATFDAALNVAGLASLDGGIDVDGAFTVANTSGNIATSGTLGVTGQSTLASAAVTDLTSGRVVLAGTSGELEDNAKLTFNGTQLDVDGNVVITGDLTVQGTQTILETQTVTVEDKNVDLGVVASPTDVTADGGGITLKGTTDKTISWVNATDAWTSSERFDLPAGAEGTPSLIFSGDVNSGVYSPGADQVAIATAGSGRLFVADDGSVGIANANPGERLSVEVNGTTNRAIEIYNGDTTLSSGELVHAIRFTQNDASAPAATHASIETVTTGSTGLLNLIFKARDNQEYVRINTSGRVGVGTSNPSGIASIHESDTTAGSSYSIGVFSTESGGLLQVGVNDKTLANPDWRFNTGTSEALAYAQGGVERFRCDSNGRFLVGTDTESGGALFQVDGDRVRISTAKTPASATATGTAGEICWDADYVYVCIATNTWKRSALSTW